MLEAISQNHEAIQALVQLQPAFEKSEVVSRAITMIQQSEKVFTTYFDYLVCVLVVSDASRLRYFL
jgi:hypothetical protein